MKSISAINPAIMKNKEHWIAKSCTPVIDLKVGVLLEHNVSLRFVSLLRDVGRAFHKYILRIFRNGWMDCRDAFHAALCLYCCVMDKT